MPSRLPLGIRRLPAQPRGERRVIELLEAAESVIAKRGLESASMSEVALRAGASIGSLYQFFDSKSSLVEGLHMRLGKAYLQHWDEFERTAPLLTVRALTTALMRLNLLFLEQHPVLPILLALPESKGVRAIGRILEQRFASILLIKRRRLPEERAMRCARMTLQVIHGFLELYSSVPSKERLAYRRECHDLIESYLALRLLSPARRMGGVE